LRRQRGIGAEYDNNRTGSGLFVNNRLRCSSNHCTRMRSSCDKFGKYNAGCCFHERVQHARKLLGNSRHFVAFLNDCNSPNALANPQDRSILFGTSMAQKLLNQFRDTIPLWQVMAHEWGHQIQYALGDYWLEASTVAPKELEADMFSGFYLLITKGSSNLASSVANAFSMGDWEFNNPSHHGTPNQRGAALLAGSRVALEYTSGAIPKTYPAVRQRFFQELTQII